MPTLPPGSDFVVMLSVGALTEMLRLALFVLGAGGAVSESVTVTVKLSVPVKVPLGVPEITPVVPFKVRPVGKLPVVTAQVYGGTPPVACSWVCGYVVLITPAGNDAVVMVNAGGAFTVKVIAWLADIFAAVEESVTWKVTELPLPAPVGVPLITPALLKLNPAGRVPAVTVQVYGLVPPDSASVAL